MRASASSASFWPKFKTNALDFSLISAAVPPRPASAGLRLNSSATNNAPEYTGGPFTRLRNELKAKEKDYEACSSSLKKARQNLSAREKVVLRKTKDFEELYEKFLNTEGELSTKNKDLSDALAAKKKLENENTHLNRRLDKLVQKVTALSEQGPGFNEELARLQSENKQLTTSLLEKSEEVKTKGNIVRQKDKELQKAQHKVLRTKELQNDYQGQKNEMLDLQRRLDRAESDNKTLEQDLRKRGADIAHQESTLASLEATVEQKDGELSKALADLKREKAQKGFLASELGLLRQQLARTEIVASRVAASEVKAGGKDEGTIPIAQYFEEVRYLQGENDRLKDKLNQAERQRKTGG
ncbi:hypothetical protein BSKO_08492 [Bryopsis sp. KO-2023]|nr:hypothetical protein BSKO_08492 [Bryopsis sp. KO-2023]